jgi:uncharacterized phage protein gp47/JayE
MQVEFVQRSRIYQELSTQPALMQKDTMIGQKDQALNEKDTLIKVLKRKLGEKIIER